MRYLLLLAASVSLSACSIFEQPAVHHSGYDVINSGHHALSGQYGQSAGCVSFDPCSDAGGYSVASAPSYQFAGHQNVIPAPEGYSPNTSLSIGPGEAVTFGSPGDCAPACSQGYAQDFSQVVYAQGHTHGHGTQYAGQQYGAGAPSAYYPAPIGALGLRGLSNSHTYGNLGGVIYDVDDANFGILGRLGYAFNSFFAAEAEGSLNVKNQEGTLTDGTTTLSASSGVDYNIAAFALARLPVTNALSVHARGGYDFRKFDAEITDGTTAISDSVDLDGFAYGVGAQYSVNPRDAIRVDYTRYENDLRNFDSVSATFVRKF
jgi:hypothetical protein